MPDECNKFYPIRLAVTQFCQESLAGTYVHAADKLANQTNQAMQGGVNGTPSFMINGKLQEAHEWKVLQPLLTAAIR